MKKSDWALVILITAVVGVISWFVIGSILPDIENESVKTIPEITANIDAPANNVMLYDADRPNWCPYVVGDNTDNESTNGDESQNNESSDSNNSASNEGKQPINSAFNACAINSSFTTTTE
jgi:hypothetical protein